MFSNTWARKVPSRAFLYSAFGLLVRWMDAHFASLFRLPGSDRFLSWKPSVQKAEGGPPSWAPGHSTQLSLGGSLVRDLWP